MIWNGLAVGLLSSGAVGFILGAKPAIIFRGNGQAQSEKVQEAMELLYPLAVAFFAGFVFSTLLPHALFHSGGSILSFASGAGVMALLSKFVFKRDPCCEVGHDHRGLGIMSLFAMSVCSINDGLLIGLLNPVWYTGLNLGMLLHKISSSFAIAQVLRRSRFPNIGLALFGLIYTLISPAALLAAQGHWIKVLPDSELVLAFSAGLLTYVTLVNLLPQARTILKRRPKASFGFVAAFLVSICLGFWHTALHKRIEFSETMTNGQTELPSRSSAPSPKNP